MHTRPLEAALIGNYDYWLVTLSVLIAMLSSYAALDVGERVTASRGWLRAIWLTGGALAMGTGIWSMHYIGMLAYSLPVPVYYDWPMVLLSLFAAVAASAIALLAVSGRALGARRIGIGALLMGFGIAGMHYIGMEAMRLPAMCHYSIPIVALSVLLAVVIALVALWLTFHLRHQTAAAGWRKLAAALAMGAAIPVMHYTGMGAVSFFPSHQLVDLTNSVKISSLGIAGIGAVTLLILSIVILTSLVDRRFSSQALELQMSEQRYRQLVDSAKVIMWRARVETHEFSYVNQEAEDLLGYPLSQWTGQSDFWLRHLHPDDRSLAVSICAETAAQGRPQRFEHRMIAADGRLVWLRTAVQLVTGPENSKEIVGVMTDITERKDAHERAEEASLAKGALLTQIEQLNALLKKENSRMSGELEVTGRLQRMMLPGQEDFRDVGPLSISAFAESTNEVGGDYYDVICEKGDVFFGIGDVTGHGLESGVLAIMVHTAIRTLLACGHRDNHYFFGILNRMVYESARRMKCDRNLTLSLLRYRDRIVTLSGQHEEVLVVRGDGAIERHDTLDLGYHLGLTEDISSLIRETTFRLDPGDAVVIYTDGITEAEDHDGRAFGIERLAEAVKTRYFDTAEEIREAILRHLRTFVGGRALHDDLTLVVIKSVEAVS